MIKYMEKIFRCPYFKDFSFARCLKYVRSFFNIMRERLYSLKKEGDGLFRHSAFTIPKHFPKAAQLCESSVSSKGDAFFHYS